MNSLVKINTEIIKKEAAFRVAEKYLANIAISSLLFDEVKIRKAIELATNARLFLDPYFQAEEILNVDIDSLIQSIKSELTSLNSIVISETIKVPKDKQSDRISIYLDLQSYSIRFLLCSILSEKIQISDCVYGGKSEIFNGTSIEPYESEINNFWSFQNEILLSHSFSWIVYVDIAAFYDSISDEIIIDLLKRKLLLSDEDKFLLLCKKYLQHISIGSFCDNFLQNVYLSDLDSLLQPYSWKYIRLTDDIRVFCKSKEDAELALLIIRKQFEKLNLKINPSKCFTVKQSTTLEKFRIDKENYGDEEVSNILDLNRIAEYPIENVFNLASYSYNRTGTFIQYKYDINLPKEVKFYDEILQKMGYSIKGMDIKDIIDDLSKKEILTDGDYEVLIKILKDAFHTFRVYLRIVRLYVLSLSSNPNSNSASNNFSRLLSFLDHSCINGIVVEERGREVGYYSLSRQYIVYCVIRIVFAEPHNSNRSQYSKFVNSKRKECWDLFYAVITRGEQYLIKEVLYIFDNEIFILPHREKGNLIKKESFWNSLLEKAVNEYKWGHVLESSPATRIVAFVDALFPDNEQFYLNKASYYYKCRKYEKALFYFQKVKSQNYSANVDFELAYCYYDLLMYDESIRFYTYYLEKHNDSAAYNNRALNYKALKSYEAAIQDFTQAIRISDNKVNYLRNRADCYVEMNLPFKALSDLNEAISLNEQQNKPDKYWSGNSNDYSWEQKQADVLLYHKRAKIKKDMGNIEGAKQDLQAYCSMEYKYEDLQYKSGRFDDLLKKL